MEITNTEPRPVMVLYTDALNMEVLRLLMTQYTVIVEKQENKITIELYQK
ncbi:MAG: hypothetical protein K2G49_05450 [Muribaculum sp.]|nr:hypothetical protein [Muribaculum sp.]